METRTLVEFWLLLVMGGGLLVCLAATGDEGSVVVGGGSGTAGVGGTTGVEDELLATEEGSRVEEVKVDSTSSRGARPMRLQQISILEAFGSSGRSRMEAGESSHPAGDADASEEEEDFDPDAEREEESDDGDEADGEGEVDAEGEADAEAETEEGVGRVRHLAKRRRIKGRVGATG